MYQFRLYHEAVGDKILDHAPVGWDALEERIVKERSRHGMSIDFTLDLEFVKDGFEFIHSVYEAYGINAEVLILIYEAERTGFQYNLIYTGTIAYEKWTVHDFPRKGVANIDFAGFHHKLLNGEDTEVNLQVIIGTYGKAMSALSMVTVDLHSQPVVQGFRGVREVSTTMTTVAAKGTSDRRQMFVFPFDKIETNSIGVYEAGEGWLEQGADAPLLESKVSGTLKIEMNLRGSIFVDDTRWNIHFDKVNTEIIFRKNNETPVSLYFYHNGDTDGTDRKDYAVERTITVDVKPGDKIYLYGLCEIYELEGTGSYVFNMEHDFHKGSFLTLGADTSAAATSAKGVMVHEAFSRVVESITGYKDCFYSEFFGRTDSSPQYPKDGAGACYMITNGFALRGFPTDYDPNEKDKDKLKRYLFVSFKQLYEAMDAIFCLGMGVEVVNGQWVVRVEPREYLYRKNEIAATLGKVSDLKKIVYSDGYYKEVEFGFKEWKIENTNGLNEFAALQTWTTPITKTKNRYEKVCEFIAAGHRIEETRRVRYSATETTDAPDDDNIFIINVVRSEGKWRAATNEGITDVSGVAAPGKTYNLRLTPARLLQNHLREFSSSFYKTDGGLFFNKGEGNYKVSLMQDGVEVENGVNVPREKIGACYYIPETYEFTSPLTQFQMKAIRENPCALITFRDSSGAILKGFLIEVSYKAQEKKGEFKLLRAND